MAADDYTGTIVTVDHPSRPGARRRGTAGGAAIRARFGLINAMADVAMRSLSRSELVAWMVLFRHADAAGEVTAAMSDIARRGGCDQATAKRAMAKLQRRGLVTRVRQGSLAGGPSKWRLNAVA